MSNGLVENQVQPRRHRIPVPSFDPITIPLQEETKTSHEQGEAEQSGFFNLSSISEERKISSQDDSRGSDERIMSSSCDVRQEEKETTMPTATTRDNQHLVESRQVVPATTSTAEQEEPAKDDSSLLVTSIPVVENRTTDATESSLAPQNNKRRKVVTDDPGRRRQKNVELFTYRELLCKNYETPPRIKEPTNSDTNAKNRPTSTSQNIQYNNVDLDKSESKGHDCSSSQNEQEQHLLSNNNKFRFFFVPKGRDMHPPILIAPKNTATRVWSAEVLEDFDPDSLPPTHFIISNDPTLTPEDIASELGFRDALQLQLFVRKHRILCVKRSWLGNKATQAYSPPTMDQIYRPLFYGMPQQKTTMPQQHRESTKSHDFQKTMPQQQVNLGPSRLLEKLSKLYREAPMEPTDLWRSYSFQMMAGRLRHLNQTLTLDNLDAFRKQIKGVGASIFEVIKEYLELQQQQQDRNDIDDPDDDWALRNVQRLIHITNDPHRKAVREMLKIWGVGPVKGMELVRAGYRTVEAVRNDWDCGKLKVPLLRNQCIGLLCCQDLLEEMDDKEVEAIAQIVRDTVHKGLQNAQVDILGSFRRRKGTYGDIDILITHPKYVTTVPPKALGRLVQDLRRRGHITYHLTNLVGMDEGEFNKSIDPALVTQFPGWDEARVASKASVSYMGVFRSPHTGRHRRIDIKFYPSREWAFATLYFTGNGYFNRSMRLWSLRKFGWTLSDHGLFERGTNRSIGDFATEQDIFKKLGLRWKEPHERDSFDAVSPLNNSEKDALNGFSSLAEFRKDEAGHRWIG